MSDESSPALSAIVARLCVRIDALEAKIAEPHETLNALIWRVDQLHEADAKQRKVKEALLLWVNAAKLGVGSEIDAVHALREALK